MRRIAKTNFVFANGGKPSACGRMLAVATCLALVPAISPAGPVTPMATVPMARHDLLNVEANAEVVALMTGLILIERDLLLGKLFDSDGMVSAEGSHFTHPRQTAFPLIKDGLAKAGAPDLEPLLIALEQATDKDAIGTAYLAVMTGLKKAKSALQPTEYDVMAAVVQATEGVITLIDASGTTQVAAYQDAWALLIVARGQLDLLVRGSDPVVKKSATKMALAIDDVIVVAPDPAASAPVPFDPALVINLLSILKSEKGAA